MRRPSPSPRAASLETGVHGSLPLRDWALRERAPTVPSLLGRGRLGPAAVRAGCEGGHRPRGAGASRHDGAGGLLRRDHRRADGRDGHARETRHARRTHGARGRGSAPARIVVSSVSVGTSQVSTGAIRRRSRIQFMASTARPRVTGWPSGPGSKPEPADGPEIVRRVVLLALHPQPRHDGPGARG